MRRPVAPPPHRAFTLLELLVVMGITSVILIASATISGNALDIHRATRADLDARRAASAVFDQLHADFARRVARPDAPVRFAKREGNDELTLLTRRPGFAVHAETAERSAAIASYRIEEQMLERAASGFAFAMDAATAPSLSAGTLSLAEFPVDGPETPVESAFDILSAGVLRFELSFVTDDPDAPLQPDPPVDRSQLRAVVATVVTLDLRHRRLLDDAGLDRLTAHFADAVAGERPGIDWADRAERLADTFDSLPARALRRVRVHETLIPYRTSP